MTQGGGSIPRSDPKVEYFLKHVGELNNGGEGGIYRFKDARRGRCARVTSKTPTKKLVKPKRLAWKRPAKATTQRPTPRKRPALALKKK